MKKLISLITILNFLMQVVPFEVKAQPVYDDMWESGDLIMPFINGSSVKLFDAGHATPFTSSDLITTGISDIWAQAFRPNGDMVMLENDATNGPVLHCHTKASGYTSTCWSPIILKNMTGGTPISTSFSYIIATDQYDNTFISFTNGDFSGKYVARVYTTTTDYDTLQLIDVSFGDTVNYPPTGVAVDHNGDLWVTSWFFDPAPAPNPDYSNIALYHDKIYCLKRSSGYTPCSGSAFDVNGGITLPKKGAIGVVVGDDNNIYVISYIGDGMSSTKYLMKIDRASNFATSSVALSKDTGLSQLLTLDIDSNGNIFIPQVTIMSPFNKTYIDCITPSMTSCGTMIHQSGAFSANPSGYNQSPSIHIDNDDNIWILVAEAGRLYCFDSNNSYKGCAYDSDTFCGSGSSVYCDNNQFTNVTEFTSHDNSYLTFTPTAPFDGSGIGFDLTGNRIYRTFKNSAGQDTAQITATVDPVISFEIRNAADDNVLTDNVCSLGTLSASSISTCEYRLGITTNATNGFTVYYDANGGLVSATDEIDAVGESTVSIGVEEYGIAFSDAAGIVAPQGNFTTDDSSVPNTSELVASSSGPYEYQVGVLNTSTLVTHKASISTVTPAGSYSQVVTITVTGNF